MNFSIIGTVWIGDFFLPSFESTITESIEYTNSKHINRIEGMLI